MASSTREEIGEAFDTLRAAMSRVRNLTFDALATPERLTYLAHLETVARQMPVPGHALINQLSDAVDPGTRDAAEADLAHRASRQRPDEVAEYARLLMLLLHPDGDFSDDERARQRGIVIGEQQCDGMSRISGLITPDLRAKIEAAWANLAAPGMNNPDDAVPAVDGEPDEETARRDTRTQAQRNHDALLAGFDSLLASGTLGQHNGLPTTVIVTTTLKDLEAAAGRAVTAGGTVLPMSNVIRMAGRAHHYLAIFDGARPLALYHTKRLASLAQRIMLLARHGGCSKPGCHIPGYWTQVHHTNGWATTCRTHINELNTFHHPGKLLRDGDEDAP
jgi:hypothetical protein